MRWISLILLFTVSFSFAQGKKTTIQQAAENMMISPSLKHAQLSFYVYDLDSNKVLADYDFNINLYRSKPKVKIIDAIITSCGADGLSKKYTWSMYKEEIDLKTKASSILYWPFFLKLAILKYLFK